MFLMCPYPTFLENHMSTSLVACSGQCNIACNCTFTHAQKTNISGPSNVAVHQNCLQNSTSLMTIGYLVKGLFKKNGGREKLKFPPDPPPFSPHTVPVPIGNDLFLFRCSKLYYFPVFGCCQCVFTGLP